MTPNDERLEQIKAGRTNFAYCGSDGTATLESDMNWLIEKLESARDTIEMLSPYMDAVLHEGLQLCNIPACNCNGLHGRLKRPAKSEAQ